MSKKKLQDQIDSLHVWNFVLSLLLAFTVLLGVLWLNSYRDSVNEALGEIYTREDQRDERIGNNRDKAFALSKDLERQLDALARHFNLEVYEPRQESYSVRKIQGEK